MTTLGTLKSRVADDILRTDLTSQIANAITDAIDYWKETRFFFTDTRTAILATVASTSAYTSTQDADIPLFIDIDHVFLTSGTSELTLERVSPGLMQILLGNNSSTGQPTRYSYWQETFRLYPTPDAVYTVRPMGQIEVAAPAADDTADNAWMVEAFELIRCTAKGLLAAHVLDDPKLQIAMFGAPGVPNAEFGMAGAAAQKLLRQTAKKNSTGLLVPTEF